MMRVRMKLFNGNFALASSVDNGLKLNLQDVMALMSQSVISQRKPTQLLCSDEFS